MYICSYLNLYQLHFIISSLNNYKHSTKYNSPLYLNRQTIKINLIYFIVIYVILDKKYFTTDELKKVEVMYQHIEWYVNRRKSIASSINEDDLCLLCYSNKKNVTLLPCKHRCCKYSHLYTYYFLIL